MNFELEERENKFAIIHCHTNVVGAEGSEFMKLFLTQVVKLADNPSLRIVVDFKDRAEVDSDTLDRLSSVGRQLASMGKVVYFVNVPVATSNLITDKGLTSFIRTLYSSPVKTEVKAPTPQLEAERELLKRLTEGMSTALQMLCPNFNAVAGAPVVKPAETRLPSDVAAQVGLRSKTFDGTLVLSFSEAFYLKMISSMHETQYTSLAQAGDDAASELLNIIRSLTRKGLHEHGYVLGKEIPQISKGPLMEKLLANSDCVIAIPFEADHAACHIQIGIAYRKAP